MAPRPPNLTQRLFLDYTSRGKKHTMEYRFNPPLDLTALTSVAGAIAYLYSTVMLNDDSFTAASYSGVGSGVRFAIPFGLLSGQQTLAGNVWPTDPESTMLSMTGKSTGSGARWRTEFFTAYNNGSGAWPATNRYSGGGISGNILTWFSDVERLLGGTYPGVPRPVAIDSSFIVPNIYVNICQNAYWQRKQRTGG